jgi:hypothetical protein
VPDLLDVDRLGKRRLLGIVTLQPDAAGEVGDVVCSRRGVMAANKKYQEVSKAPRRCQRLRLEGELT